MNKYECTYEQIMYIWINVHMYKYIWINNVHMNK